MGKLVSRDQVEALEFKVTPDHKVYRASREPLVKLEQLEIQVTWELLAHPVLLDSRVLLVTLELPGSREQRVYKVKLDNKDKKALQDPLAMLAHLVIKVQQEALVLLAVLASQDLQGLLETLEQLELKDSEDLLDQLDSKGLQE